MALLSLLGLAPRTTPKPRPAPWVRSCGAATSSAYQPRPCGNKATPGSDYCRNHGAPALTEADAVLLTHAREQWLNREQRLARFGQGEVVYFLVRYDQIKIGTTRNLRSRVTEMQHEMQDILAALPGGYALENEWHRRWAHLRVRGEWFRAENDLLDAIHVAQEAALAEVTRISDVTG